MGCWALPDVALAVEQTTKREHLNIARTNNLEHRQPPIPVVEPGNSGSAIVPLGAIKWQFRLIAVSMFNALMRAATWRGWFSNGLLF